MTSTSDTHSWSDVASRPTAVIGAGTLGRRVALMLATRGGNVRLFDTSDTQLMTALAFIEQALPNLVERNPERSIGHVSAAETLSKAVADTWLVIEALPERLDLKRTVFAELDKLALPDTILATNSSSYPSSRLVQAVSRPERLVNTHFLMPPAANAVEIMSCGHTDRRTIELLMSALPEYGFVPFEVSAESVGFIYNRIWAAIKREALSVVAEGVATPLQIDEIFKLTLGSRNGPFRMMDAVGLDVVLDIEEHYAAIRENIEPAPRELLRKYIFEGRLGRKSGRGFYDDYPAVPEAAEKPRAT